MRIVLKPSSRHHRLQVRCQRDHATLGDEFAEVETMSAEIADDKGVAGLRWIGAPRRLLALALARSR